MSVTALDSEPFYLVPFPLIISDRANASFTVAELRQCDVSVNGFDVAAFAAENYWSSTEINASNAWNQNFSNGNQNANNKTNTYRVRAVRR